MSHHKNNPTMSTPMDIVEVEEGEIQDYVEEVDEKGKEQEDKEVDTKINQEDKNEEDGEIPNIPKTPMETPRGSPHAQRRQVKEEGEEYMTPEQSENEREEEEEDQSYTWQPDDPYQ